MAICKLLYTVVDEHFGFSPCMLYVCVMHRYTYVRTYNGNVSTVDDAHKGKEDDKVKHVVVIRLYRQASTDLASGDGR